MNRLLPLLVKHNPFYLLSALSMLVGCYTLSNALRLESAPSWKLPLLLGTLHVYEFLLIGLGLFLIKRRALSRDGAILLRLEVLFLADATLLHAEAFTSDIVSGGLANLATLALAGVKLALVLNALGVGLSRFVTLALGHALALLIAVPGVFALLASARALSDATVYAAWWPLGLLIVLMTLAAKRVRREVASAEAQAFLGMLALALPASMALHLIATGWVYQVPFRISFLGAVLIGFGVASVLADLPWVGPRWRLAIPGAGVLLSIGSAPDLTVVGPLGVTLTPFREALFFASVGYLAGARVLKDELFALAAASAMFVCVAGHSPSAVGATLGMVLRELRGGGASLFPSTAAGWGALSVAAAFVLLASGAWVSLLQGGGSGSPEPPTHSRAPIAPLATRRS